MKYAIALMFASGWWLGYLWARLPEWRRAGWSPLRAGLGALRRIQPPRSAP